MVLSKLTNGIRFWERSNPRFLSMLLLFSACLSMQAQKVISASDKMKPVWLAVAPPAPGNSSFVYQITEGEHTDKAQAQASCLFNLTTYIKQTNYVTGETKVNIDFQNQNGNSSENENYIFEYEIKGEKVYLTSTKQDEYWEYIAYPDGKRVYRYYTLYSVAKTPGTANFDELRFTRKYGARGFLRSMIVPGWGQLYKGNTAKGAIILGGEVVLIGGIIVSENLRSSYTKKMKENPQHMNSYNTKADNWENIRNAFIGGAACLYVYNLVDAIVANGRKRTIVKKNRYFTFNPVMTPDYNGVQLTYNF